MTSRQFGSTLKRLVQNKLLAKSIEMMAGLSVIITVIAMWAIYLAQRSDALNLQRKQLSVNMLTLGHDENVAAAKSAVTAFVVSHRAKIHDASVAMAKGEPTDLPIDEKSKIAFLAMTEYYDQVLKCRGSGECDPVMIDLWFQQDICSFTEFAQLAAFPALADEFGTHIGDKLVDYQKTCPRDPA